MKVYKYINNISLNPREYLQSDNGEELEFERIIDIVFHIFGPSGLDELLEKTLNENGIYIAK